MSDEMWLTHCELIDDEDTKVAHHFRGHDETVGFDIHDFRRRFIVLKYISDVSLLFTNIEIVGDGSLLPTINEIYW